LGVHEFQKEYRSQEEEVGRNNSLFTFHFSPFSMLDSITKRKVTEAFRDAVTASHADFGDDTLLVSRERILEIMLFLRDDPALKYEFMMDLTVVDYINEVPRFEVVYHLYSLAHNHRVRIKARIPFENPAIGSICSVWKAANWFEREAYDLYGINFAGHPDLRRILLYPEFVGHPLRKDYPVAKRQPLIKYREPDAPPDETDGC
jgi:NADH-quinone oxidoreductase subunit C